MRRLLVAFAAVGFIVGATAAHATVPTPASYTVHVRARYVAEDACAILVVRDYQAGLTGSTYRCAGPDREVTP